MYHSLRFRLPLAMTGLIAAVLFIFLWALNRQVERAVLFAGGERAQVAAVQLATVLAPGAVRGIAETQKVGLDQDVRSFFQDPAPALRPLVEQRLRSTLAAAGQPPSITLMNSHGEPILTLETSPPGSPAYVPAASAMPSYTGIGPLQTTNGRIFSEVAVRLEPPPGASAAEALGTIVVRRPVQSGPNSEVIARLVGRGARFAVGNRTGDVWTDFTGIIPAPHSNVSTNQIVTTGSGSGARIGALSLVDSTPWAVWIDFPQATVLAPARAALRRLLAVAGAFLFVAAVLVAVLSNRLTRPLQRLTQATEAIASGKPAPPLAVDRKDEIGRLSAAFATMSTRIAEAQRGLEARVAERTASLAETRAQLEQQVEELERARMELDQFFALSPDMLCIANLDGRFVRVNDAWHEVLGWSEEELTARPYVEFVHPDDRTTTSAESASLAEGQATTRFENRYRCRDGSYRWLSWRAAPILSRGVVYAAARDITERRRVDTELKAHAAALAELNRELEAFSYSVSHDLRAPLRHITGFVGLLSRSATAKLDAEEQRRLRTIADAATRMGRLVDDLLAFSRMGRTALQKRRISLADIVRDARREIDNDPAGGRVTWKIGPLPDVDADPAMLRLVFVNLMSNAVKYTRGRPGPSVEIGVERGSAVETVIFVRDNGVGFDMQYAGKLFGVFQRLHSSDEFEGTGIGLANVRRIINRHGGRTWAQGAPDAGATFYFSLPLVTAAAVA
jgi:PAS domain S-box-containing protein